MIEPRRRNGKSGPPCSLKIGREERRGGTMLAEMVAEGFLVKQELDRLKEKLGEINLKIAAHCRDMFEDNKTVHVLTPEIDCTLSVRDKVEILHPEELKKVLGKRFDDLVRTNVAYLPEKKLADMAVEGGDDLSDKIRTCLSIREAPVAVSYKKR